MVVSVLGLDWPRYFYFNWEAFKLFGQVCFGFTFNANLEGKIGTQTNSSIGILPFEFGLRDSKVFNFVGHFTLRYQCLRLPPSQQSFALSVQAEYP